MKMKDIRVGMFVVTKKEQWNHPLIPQVGTVTGITYEYDFTVCIKGGLNRELRVLPMVHFLGESSPRGICSSRLEVFKGND